MVEFSMFPERPAAGPGGPVRVRSAAGEPQGMTPARAPSRVARKLTLADVIGNIVPDIYEGAQEAVGLGRQLFRDPVGTGSAIAEGFAALPGGTTSLLARKVLPKEVFEYLNSLEGDQEDAARQERLAGEFWGDLYEQFGSPEKIQQTVYANPVSAAAALIPGHKGAMTMADIAERQALRTGEEAAEAGAKRGTFAALEADPARQVLAARAEQMSMPVAKRVRPGNEPYFETTPEAYLNPRYMPEQAKIYIPRQPEGTNRPLPKGGRAQPLIDMREAIAQKLAERMQPYLGTEAQFFYNTGPIRKKAEELGFDKKYIDDWMREFGSAYAATSPRTTTAQNLRNASLQMYKSEQGLPLDQPVVPYELTDPKTGATRPGLSDLGYNMMLGPEGIHRQLSGDVYNPGVGLSPFTNPKPTTFAQNVYGNLSETTVDTHAIRAALDAMNEVEPGSIPENWIKPEFREAYKTDPSKFEPANWTDDKIASQKLPGMPQAQTEYAPLADIYRRAGEILGVPPAEAQSMGWFASGKRTGLSSELKSVPTLLQDRIDVTSKLLKIPKDEVFKLLLERKIPLAEMEPQPGQAFSAAFA